MRNNNPSLLVFILCIAILSQSFGTIFSQPGSLKNIWTKAPESIPSNNSVDAPLMGNGDLTMSVGSKGGFLRYYLSKNDFWRLLSQADNLSGPRVVGFVDIEIKGLSGSDFSAEQFLADGVTTCRLSDSGKMGIEAKSWVSATENVVIIELNAIVSDLNVWIKLTAPDNSMANLNTGTSGDIIWLDRAFTDSVDIPTEAAVALRVLDHNSRTVLLKPGNKLILVLCIESILSSNEPLKSALKRVEKVDRQEIERLSVKHADWWNKYWSKSSVFIDDPVLMKAWYQGLYTMAACSRNPDFPPGLFGWTTTDTPEWNGDYHLNYNFQASFYSLYSSNRLEQAIPHDSPLFDFMERGEWYAANVTKTRGILYPVGIGPLGIEVTRNFELGGYQRAGDIELEGLFYGQRSNAAYGLVNMAQHWRCTYDPAYGRKIYPYALDVVNFWEDYLKFENGRYVIYGDAIHEGSGVDKNPVLSLGLIRNALDLILDLSTSLKVDEFRQEKWKDILLKISEFPVQTRHGRRVFRYTEEGIEWFDSNGLGIQHIYPSNAITLDSNEELLTVARTTVDEMQRWHDMNTSNSFFVAAIRIGYDPVKVLTELKKYAVNSYPNGFQSGNPHGIENSCTVTNALNEMFCMSAGNVIRLFCTFPSGVNAGFENLRAWGAFLVSAKLTGGVISDVRIFSERGKQCTLVNPWPDRKVKLIRNGRSSSTLDGNRLSFETSINESLELRPI